MTKDVTPDDLKLEFATWTDKDINYLVKLIDKSFHEINLKFHKQIKSVKNKTSSKDSDIFNIDLSSLKKNKLIYQSFKEKRKEHIDYFKKYPKYVRDKLTKHLNESMENIKFNGVEVAKAALPLARTIKMTDDMARRHANFIARDQLGKFSSAINEAQAEYIGSKRYRWRTSLDNRVRPEHAKREGKIFYYSSPPKGGNPGQDYRCRCVAEAIINL